MAKCGVRWNATDLHTQRVPERYLVAATYCSRVPGHSDLRPRSHGSDAGAADHAATATSTDARAESAATRIVAGVLFQQ
eukprot:scaffold7335_cov417-Prasinococcus_capsulatus_cf.AAC.5